MKKRSPLAVVLLSLITFGIYDLYWLVKTKKVLNEKTRQHTPTIWLLIVPYIVLSAGYTLLFVGSAINASNDASVSSSSTSSGSVSTGSGEQLIQKGERRPPQYVHICDRTDNEEYVSQGSPRCLDSDTYRGDYNASVAGTVYSSPCKTTSGELRYIYISTNERCPPGTTLVFYNTTVGNDSAVFGGSSSTSDTTSNDQITHGALYLWSLGLIIIGFITTFLASIYWFFQFSKAINEYTRGKMSTAVTFLILWLIHLIGVALIQDTFNDMDEAATAAMPPAPFAPAATQPSAQQPAVPITPQPTISPPPAIVQPPQPQPTAPSPASPTAPMPTPTSEPPNHPLHSEHHKPIHPPHPHPEHSFKPIDKDVSDTDDNNKFNAL